MKMRRVLTALLALVMVLSAVPFGAMAAGGDTTTEENGKLFLDKQAVLTDDGSYKIIMEAYATGKTTSQTIEKGVPLDIVLVLDQSGSMDDELGSDNKLASLKSAATTFVEKVYQNGKKFGVTHRIGMVGFGSVEEPDYPDYNWHGTGVFDQNGKFQQYKGKDPTAQETYVPYNGTLDTKGTYYVYDTDGKPVQLTYYGNSDRYVKVTDPATDRTDLYGLVNGQYEQAAYGEYQQTTRTEVTPVEGTEGYVDAYGNPLTWKTITVPGGKVYKPISESGKTIQQNEYYWIEMSDGSYREISYRASFFDWSKKWRDNSGNVYTVAADNTSFSRKGKNYPACKPEALPDTTKTVLATADGKEYKGTVYTEITATKTGWHVGNTAVTTLYEIQKGIGQWKYKDGKKTVDLTNEQVYTKTTKSVYSSALVPVANGKNGSGSKRGSFAKAIGSLKADGATRIATGIELGNKVFDANPLTEADKAAGRQRIMIIFTDGEPGADGYDSTEANRALTAIKTTKAAGTTVYTIGLYNSASSKQTTFMNKLSSNYDKDNKDEVADKYYHQVKNASALEQIFQSIQEDISGSTTNVDLTTTSILRDIMSAEGFELTNKSVVTVSIVPGDASKAADETQIKWGTPVKVLTLQHDPNAANGVTSVSKKNVTVSGSDGKNAMTIEASTHTKNPEGKANLHTVDVTGFDYKDQYIAQAHKGSKLVVEITGVKALPTVTTDKNIHTNHEQSGIWAPKTTGGKREFTAPFPKRPETYMPSASYVVDYAKPLDLAIANFKMKTVKNIDVDGYNPFNPANTAITHKYGDVKLAENKLTYTPKTMQWDGADTFYVFGTTNNATVTAASANADGNVWSKVNVIPANNVYYEDSFISNKSTGTVGITYTGTWDEVKGTEPNANGGAAEGDPNTDNHGWIPVLKDETGDTDGSSHHVDVTSGDTATAKFTFTGTGVDVYSRTNGQTGTVVASLVGTAKNSENKPIIDKSLFVDTLSASGEYYQIPTLTFDNLPYDTYTLELAVTTASTGRYEYYLDGVRVYNPLNGGHEAYAPDEKNAQFMEVRDMLLDANSFSAEANGVSNGFVFIDQLNNGTDGAPGTEGNTDKVLGVGTYEDLGPKNEVYLKPGQAISFKVDTTKGNKFQIGLKSPTGKSIKVLRTGAGYEPLNFAHTADMYYDVAPADNGVITISNPLPDNGNGELLAITKLKVTNANATVNTAAVFAETDVPTLLTATRANMDAAQTPTEPDIDIENPEVKPEKPGIIDILDKIFGGIFDWIRP